MITPARTPAVLHLPVISSGISAIADQQYTVISVGSTAVGNDTSSVVLEDVLVGLNGNGHRLLLSRRHQVIVGGFAEGACKALHTLNSAGWHCNITTRRLARREETTLGDIRVRCLAAAVMLHGPLQGIGHLAA